jgi:hypothetical protein
LRGWTPKAPTLPTPEGKGKRRVPPPCHNQPGDLVQLRSFERDRGAAAHASRPIALTRATTYLLARLRALTGSCRKAGAAWANHGQRRLAQANISLPDLSHGPSATRSRSPACLRVPGL